MNGTHEQPKTILEINLCMLGAVFLGGVAWLLWPESAEGWRAGSLSIACGLSGLGLAIRGIDGIRRHIIRDINVSWFKRQGRAPQSDGVVGDEAMNKAGLID